MAADLYNYTLDELKPGTILECEWGYSMVIIHFYKVLSTRGKSTVVLQKLQNKQVGGDGFHGWVVPSDIPDKSPITARWSSKSKCIKLSKYEYLKIWDGQKAWFDHLD